MKTLKDLMDMSGTKVLVTGGAGHIALAVEETLAELGATISVLDVSETACLDRVATLSSIRANSAVALPCDLSDERQARAAVQRAINVMGGLDVLIHTAAYVGTTEVSDWAAPFDEQSVHAWDAVMRVNLTAAFVLVQEGKDALAASGRGSVIFFASHYGIVGPDLRLYENTSMTNSPAYGTSKAGLLQLMKYFSTVLAPQVRVNCISPGGVWRQQPEEFLNQYVYRTPLGRMALEEDLKGAVAYLASDLSAYVTGHNLVVDGGFTAW